MSGKAKSNVETNTGHRFISKNETTFKVHVHAPDDTIIHRSVEFLRRGESIGLKKAIKLRNEIGSKLWGKHWRVVLKDPLFITRLPHSLEPKIVYKPRHMKDGTLTRSECYIAAWVEERPDGTRKTRSLVRSVEKHGRLAAYTACKRALLEGNSQYIEILDFMGRVATSKLK